MLGPLLAGRADARRGDGEAYDARRGAARRGAAGQRIIVDQHGQRCATLEYVIPVHSQEKRTDTRQYLGETDATCVNDHWGVCSARVLQ